MNFNTDKQTLDDLNILGRPGTDSVFSVYNNTRTRGGAELLEQMFLYPLADVSAINDRSRTFQYFASLKVRFPFKTEHLDSCEMYLSLTDQRTKLTHRDNNLARKISSFIATDGDYQLVYQGIISTVALLQTLNIFAKELKVTAFYTAYGAELAAFTTLLAESNINLLLAGEYQGKLSYSMIVDFDNIIRFQSLEKIKALLNHIYHLDVYIAIARIAAERSFIFPKAADSTEHTLKLQGVYHPLVKNAVPNTLYITAQSNVVFLTGANMAGKSTFMKSLGIALYLAHMGFPVAASHMEFSVRHGIYTTINLPDDLSSGNSHFYAEVLRVKKVAKELAANKNLFIVFDELFRGTNVKDAYEGTIAITQAFAQKQNCMFVISTHITEAGEILRERCENINFIYLPTKMEGKQPVYTYKLEAGITADRHGMVIINNEGILEIIKSRKSKTTNS